MPLRFCGHVRKIYCMRVCVGQQRNEGLFRNSLLVLVPFRMRNNLMMAGMKNQGVPEVAYDGLAVTFPRPGVRRAMPCRATHEMHYVAAGRGRASRWRFLLVPGTA